MKDRIEYTRLEKKKQKKSDVIIWKNYEKYLK